MLSCIGQIIAHNSSELASVSFHVQGEVVRPAELARTQMTFEWFLACVFAVVPGQLIGASKLPSTARPRALVRLLPSVRPFVGLQVRALGVDLVTGREVALVDFPLLVGARVARRHR